MPLSAEDLADIDAVLTAAEAGAEAIAALRARFSGLSITLCDPSDVDTEDPFKEYERFDLHLVDAAGHCWQLTKDSNAATGIVVVKKRNLA
ncbi:hypothetical protein KKP04_09025 [Rhodomicrobium sp. Az07]|uniref:hypothetical protein n=1 Tax=Rhodomicrobium sp. Az07 TaxID=2839034 RepID=UPI001BE6210A|nr:hypothetical protein [Rhodomicrobium sp. Az07]MBT3071010.1 hypothetical protein [Rhodomicrobium sp. Az07]